MEIKRQIEQQKELERKRVLCKNNPICLCEECRNKLPSYEIAEREEALKKRQEAYEREQEQWARDRDSGREYYPDGSLKTYYSSATQTWSPDNKPGDYPGNPDFEP